MKYFVKILSIKRALLLTYKIISFLPYKIPLFVNDDEYFPLFLCIAWICFAFVR